jgi:hypothetical protein
MVIEPNDPSTTNCLLSGKLLAPIMRMRLKSHLEMSLTRGCRGPRIFRGTWKLKRTISKTFGPRDAPLLHAMQTVIAPFETWAGLVAVTQFPPASTIMGAMMLLIQGTKKVSKAFDMITDLFRRLGHFVLRLASYKGVPLSEWMKLILSRCWSIS